MTKLMPTNLTITQTKSLLNAPTEITVTRTKSDNETVGAGLVMGD